MALFCAHIYLRMLSKKDLTKLLLKGATCEDCATSTCKRRKKLCKSWTNRADVPDSSTMLRSQIYELMHQLDMMKKLKEVDKLNPEASFTLTYLQNMIELYLKTYPDQKWKIIFDANKLEADH